jgi:tetratricopeptide (TPR) repeat protein
VAHAAAPANRTAHQKFMDGDAAYKRKDFRTAAEFYESAYKRKPHHKPLLNAARSWDDAEEFVRAANLLEQYLKEAPAAESERPKAIQRLEKLRSKLGRMEVHGEGVTEVRLNGELVSTETIYVPPGEHGVTGMADGTVVRKSFRVAAGEVVQATILAPTLAVEPPKPMLPETWERPLSPWYVVGGAAVTVGAGVFTLASGLRTVSLRDDFRDGPDVNKTQAALERVQGAQTLTNVGLGVTIGTTLITATLAAFLVDWSGGKNHKTGKTRYRGMW